jgi:endonuclease/exonuclease/phosphatase family metal-dependent hydrolase
MGPDRTVRVLTLNCWNLSEPFADRMAIIRRGMATLRPDVAAFQEVVVRRGEVDQTTLLVDGGDHFRVFGPAFGWDDDGAMLSHDQATSGFGNLIVSRWPIARAEVRRLPGREGDEPRTATGALVETPHGILPVLTTHLDWELDHGWVREQQVRAVDAFARELAPAADLPAVLMGDFNAPPDSTEMRHLRGLASIEGRSTYFQDAWEIAGPGGPGFTWDNRNRFAAQSREPDRRIDYVLVRPPDSDGRGHIVEARLAFDAPEADVFASDHFGLLADIRI